MALNIYATKRKNAPPINKSLISIIIFTNFRLENTRSIRSPTPLTKERISEIIAE